MLLQILGLGPFMCVSHAIVDHSFAYLTTTVYISCVANCNCTDPSELYMDVNGLHSLQALVLIIGTAIQKVWKNLTGPTNIIQCCHQRYARM